jgi:hypothetical protein
VGVVFDEKEVHLPNVALEGGASTRTVAILRRFVGFLVVEMKSP